MRLWHPRLSVRVFAASTTAIAIVSMFVASKAFRVGTTVADMFDDKVFKIREAELSPSGVRSTPTYFDIADRSAVR